MTVTNFKGTGGETIDLRAVKIAEFKALKKLTDEGGDVTLLRLNKNVELILSGTELAGPRADDFLF